MLFNRGYFDICEEDGNASSPSWKNVTLSESEQQLSPKSLDRETEKDDGESFGRSSSFPHQVIPGHKKFFSGSLPQDSAYSPKKLNGDGDR